MSTDTAGLALVRYELRRVAQTRRTFENWPVLLQGMVAEKIGRGTATLEFVTRAGVRISCPNVPGARLPIYEQFADDCYRLRDFLAPFVGVPFRVLDVGAHIGSFAINVASTHPDARVDCYEPSPQSARFLRGNVGLNGLADRVTVHEFALADTAGTALLDDNDGGSVHNGLIQSDRRLVDGSDALSRRHAIEVPTTTFDAAVAAAPRGPEVVKMDCEGGEYALVYASSPQSWSTVQRIVMEYHPVPGQTWDELRKWFEGIGFAVVDSRSDSPGLGTAWLARTAVTGTQGASS